MTTNETTSETYTPERVALAYFNQPAPQLTSLPAAATVEELREGMEASYPFLRDTALDELARITAEAQANTRRVNELLAEVWETCRTRMQLSVRFHATGLGEALEDTIYDLALPDSWALYVLAEVASMAHEVDASAAHMAHLNQWITAGVPASAIAFAELTERRITEHRKERGLD